MGAPAYGCAAARGVRLFGKGGAAWAAAAGGRARRDGAAPAGAGCVRRGSGVRGGRDSPAGAVCHAAPAGAEGARQDGG